MSRLGRGQPNRPFVRRAPAAGAPPTVEATLTVGITLTATATKHVEVDATITIGIGLTATATKVTAGIGLPPRPRLRWQLIAGPASGGHSVALTEAKSRRIVFRLEGQHEIACSLNGRHPQAEQVDELATDIHALWTSTAGSTEILARCRVGNIGDDITADKHTMTVPAQDYRALLRRRRLYSTSTLTYTGVDQAEIAMGLIADTQARAGGDLGIGKGWTGTSPTGITRDRTYEAGDSIGERVQELSEVLDGFDWDITPVSASALRLDVWYPQRGNTRGVVLLYGGLVASARREVNAADYANSIRMTGEEALTAVESESADLASLPQGRWDAVYGDSGLTTQSALNDRAAWQLATAEVITPVWTVTLRRGAWDGPDHIWLGDPCRLVVRSGRLETDVTLRVYEIAISLADTGAETVELTLGGPKPDYRRRPALTERRLTNLERR